MQTVDLAAGWSVSAINPSSGVPDAVAGRSIPANVPGCIHTDLLAADLIVDPDFDQNEA